ncbi:MAG: hypothetical protein J6B91_03615 [Prevotella sp.]|nr:hypothetical protein [Prevotella sp.]
MKKSIILLTILLAIPFCISAQPNSKRAKSASKTKTGTDPRIERMIVSTQDIIFIDSIVIDKDIFLSKYKLSPEVGSLYTYDEFFKGSDSQPNSFVHVNEMENKCYFSIEEDQGDMKLYTCDKLDGNWTEPTPLKGLYKEKALEQLNYPFIMADGTTLYFSAKGEESIGGWDIFATRFDSDEGVFLEPENIGMPFNSEANDYMFAIDELNNIGWFVTDRNQTNGKVCIYIFIPSETRQTYPAEKFSTEELKGFANISKISNTWKDGTERKKALNRLASIKKKGTQKGKAGMRFVINDNTVYDKITDFRSKDNINKYKLLTEQKEQLANIEKTLEKARAYYATANPQEKTILKSEILKSEQQYEALEMNIKKIEKEIRNTENNLLNHNKS